MAKTTSYVNDGYGRDSYIQNFNGGFYPEKSPTKMHPISKWNDRLFNWFLVILYFISFNKRYFSNSISLGSFVIQKNQPSSYLAQIHSKPVVYANNGGGRDTYIS